MRLPKYALCLCLAWAAFAPPVWAQFICHVTEGATIGHDSLTNYAYTALSCKGNNVVVAARVDGFVGTANGFYLAFLISTDGGVSWSVKNGGLPGPSWDHNPIVTSIDQIDSLNIVALGDSVHVRSTDGGATWQELTNPSKRLITGVSFSDPMHGMLTVADVVHGTYITTNGGADWSTAPFTRPYGWRCHDYGGGKYRIVMGSSGVVYTTMDSWNTVDSTGPIITDSSMALHYKFGRFSFGAGDTIFAYGNRYSLRGNAFPCIARTTDGGKQWTSVYDDTSSFLFQGTVIALSDLGRDTIVAGVGSGFPNKVLWSTDRGVTWRFDTLICDSSKTSPNSHTGNVGIGLNSEGQLLAAYDDGLAGSTLLLGQRAEAGVISHDVKNIGMQLYPNPATTSITITGADAGRAVYLLDVLGREVLRAEPVAKNDLSLDVSTLPAGVYYVTDGLTRAKFVKE